MKYLITAILILASACLSAQLHNLRFASYQMADGMSSPEVLCSFTDPRGIVWFGTRDGLNSFDGDAFKVHRHRRSDKHSLPHSTILAISHYTENEMLVATTSGIARFNYWSGRCISMPLDSTVINPSPCIRFLHDDHGNLWAWSIDILYQWDPKENSFRKMLQCDHHEGRPDRIAEFYQDHYGKFWIGAYDGLYEFHPNNLRMVRYSPEERSILINSIYEDQLGRMWCGSWGNGILCFNREKKSFTSYVWDKDPVIPSATNIVYGFTETMEEGDCIIWAATNYGLASIHSKDDMINGEELSFCHHKDSDPNSLCSDDVRSVSMGRSGEMWICTGNGISVMMPSDQLFQPFSSSLKGQVISLESDKSGGYFAATWYGDGLQQFDQYGNRIAAWNRIPAHSPDAENMQISDVLLARDNALWIASFGGLYRADAAGNHFEEIKLETLKSEVNINRHYTCLTEDLDGNIWCGTYGNGIDVYLKKESKLIPLENSEFTTQGLSHPLIWDLLCDRSGNIWIALNNGISNYTPSTHELVSYTTVKIDGETFSLGICNSLFSDHRGQIWCGSENGLLMHSNNYGFKIFDEENGVFGNQIASIIEDQNGMLWVSTSEGIVILNEDQKLIRKFTFSNGLPFNSQPYVFMNLKDQIILGGNSSAYLINPQAIHDLSSTHEVFLTSVSTATGSLFFEKNPSTLEALILKWNENFISFDFVAPIIEPSHSGEYEYRLSGSEMWLKSGQNHNVSFAGLTPGNYTFEVRYVKQGFAGPTTTYHFIVEPPIWKTWWFFAIVTAMILAISTLFIWREISRRLSEKSLEVEKLKLLENERSRISRDMHDDLGAGLTRIAIMSEVVKRQINRPEIVDQQLQVISETSRNLVDSLNEIIWSLNPENDKLANLVAYLREYVGQYLDSVGINFIAEISQENENVGLGEEKRRYLFLVVKEAIHNSVKHSKATEVKLYISPNPAYIDVYVTDNGCGFDVTLKQETGDGLKNMKNRMIAIGATYELTSAPDHGTKISIRIPTDKTTS